MEYKFLQCQSTTNKKNVYYLYIYNLNCAHIVAGNEKFVFWENYFDMPGFLVCAQLVDYLDRKAGFPWMSLPFHHLV